MNTTARKKASTRTVPPPKPKKDKRATSLHRELSGLLFLVLSVYALTCVLFTEGTGSLGTLVRSCLLGLLGPVGAFAAPASLATVFFFGRKLRRNGVLGRKIFFSIITVLSLVSALQLLLAGIPPVTNAVDTVGDLWVKAKDGEGGGLIGGLIAIGAGMALGRVFATVALILVSLICLSFAVGSSACGIWTSIGDLLCIERAPKSDVPKKRKKRKGEAQPEPEPEDPLVALLSSNGGDGFGSASGDVLAPVATDVSYGEDEDDYGSNDSYSYMDTVAPEIPVTVTEAYSDDGYGDVDEPYSDVATDDGITFAPEEAMPEATVAEDATAEEDESDDSDDTDPFAPTPIASKARRFGRLVGKRGIRSADELDEDEKEAVADRSEPQEPEPAPEPDVKKWEMGDRYVYPPTSLLNAVPESSGVSEAEVMEVADKILRKLESMRVKASLVGYSIGPAVTRYEIAPGEGVRVNKISQLISDIALELASEGLRIEAPIPGKSAIGIEVPNKKVSLVSFRALVENPKFNKAKSKITVCIGKNISGEVEVMDIDDMPHVLIAGQTKSGKSVAINCMLLSLLYRVTPDEVKLILIDPKRVEFNIYSKIPHLVMPVIDDPTQAAAALSWAVKEMERRYDLMKTYNARNREEYLKKTAGKADREAFPQIIIIIDELADMMLQVKEHVEPLINRIAAKARACGMHLLIGTQRPSTDVITGLIKANIPARISFKVAEQVDARIIGATGAERLLGKGDLLYHPTGGAVIRAQGAYVDGDELNRVIDYIIENNGEASFDPEVLAQLEEEQNSMLRVKKRGGAMEDEDDDGMKGRKMDPLLINAIEIAVENQSISTSSLQRYLEVGYGRGAKLLDAMERLGIVGPPNGSKPREVYMTMEQFKIWKLEQQFD